MAGSKFYSGIDMVSSRVSNLSDPSSAQDAATKAYVDNVAAGLNWKANVKVASTANLAVASAVIAGAVVDGVTLVAGDRILLKNQTTASENGIYIVAASGAASRASDNDTSAEVQNSAVRVAQGTVGADTIWQMVTDGITLGTTSLVWTQFTGGTTYTQGNGITISGGVVTALADPVTGGGIVVTSSGIKVDVSVVVRKFAVDFGDGSATSYTITHNLGTLDVQVQIVLKSTGETVYADVIRATTNTCTVSGFGTAPATNTLRALVQG